MCMYGDRWSKVSCIHIMVKHFDDHYYKAIQNRDKMKTQLKEANSSITVIGLKINK